MARSRTPLHLEYGDKDPKILTLQRFLVKHGFMTYREVNSNPGYFGDATAAGLQRFGRAIGVNIPTREIEEFTVGHMLSLDNRYLTNYARNRGYYGQAATYIANPETHNLANQTTGARFPDTQFQAKRVTFVIDPGHGVDKRQGRDPGAMDGGLQEHALTLQLSRELGAALNRRGYNAILTRGSGFPDSGDGFAFRYRTGLLATGAYISMHIDAAEGRVKGSHTRVHMHSEASRHSAHADLREDIADHHRGDLIADPKFRSNAWKPISYRRLGQVPAVLMENGFITDAGDRARLTDPRYRRRYVEELADNLVRSVDMREDLARLAGRSSGYVPQRPTREAPEPRVPAPGTRHRREDLPQATPPRVETAEAYSYAVTHGDGWYSIAHRFCVDVDDLKRANPHARKGLKPDQEITIPGLREVDVNGGLLSTIRHHFAGDRTVSAAKRPSEGDLLRLVQQLNDITNVNQVRRDDPIAVPKDLRTANEMIACMAEQQPTRAVVPATMATPKADRHDHPDTHKVRRGETFTSIAEKYHLELAELRAANRGNRSLEAGETLRIPDHKPVPAPAAAAAKPATPAPKPGTLHYTVKPGDSYTEIAEHFHVDLAKLRQANKDNPRLQPGENIVIPGYKQIVVQPGQTLFGIANAIPDHLHKGCTVGQVAKALEKLNGDSTPDKGDAFAVPTSAAVLGDLCPATPAKPAAKGPQRRN